jgi:hypothetical protein
MVVFSAKRLAGGFCLMGQVNPGKKTDIISYQLIIATFIGSVATGRDLSKTGTL